MCTPSALGAISRAVPSQDGRTLYAAVRYPGRVPHLVSISLEDGAVTELQEIGEAMQYRVASVAFDPEAGTLFYTTDHMGYRNLMAYDLKSGKARMLLEEQRIGDLAFNRADRSLWGLRTNNGYVILVRIPYPYKEWQRIHVFPYGEVAFDLDVSPDGALVSTSVAGLDSSRAGAQVMQVRVMKTDALLAGDATPVRTLTFGSSVPEGFVFSQDGRYLYGSSYYTGVSNIYRCEIATGEVEAVSNAEVGFFRPVPLPGDELLVFSYTARGFVPAMIRPSPDRGPERDHVSRRADRDPAPGRAELERGFAGAFRCRQRDQAAGYLQAGARNRARGLLSDHRGLQEFGGARPACALQRSDGVRAGDRDGKLQHGRFAAVE